MSLSDDVLQRVDNVLIAPVGPATPEVQTEPQVRPQAQPQIKSQGKSQTKLQAEAKVLPFRPPGRSTAEPEPTDAELLARCRDRDADAWDLLVKRYERLVFSVARRNGLSTEDASDVTQATFLALLDALDKLRDEERLASWLMTVARRQSWRIRNLSRRNTDLDAVPEASEDPFVDWHRSKALHDALATLGGPCRELLEALYLDDSSPSYAEIAERMGRSIGGIGPMRGRCLEKLRALLGEDGEW